MAKIKLDKLKHTYVEAPKLAEDWALQQIDIEWDNGGAYALLGPSGCGKTTLLNIISGLIKPSYGNIFFDDKDITEVPTGKRNIAQVFQFPVIYDTMTVYDNLAFPLRNRKISEDIVAKRVKEIADLIELTPMLNNKASGLTASDKQKISLGRGLVRTDVSAILFDEPLTVIDPQLKWKLRSKLKELHQLLKLTMIYVTHDQTEALTFADKVVVMNAGEMLQIGTPVELFEKPQHTFVGYFIGSPGMNILPCNIGGNEIKLGKYAIKNIPKSNQIKDKIGKSKKLEIGIRPEFIKLSNRGLPVDIIKVSNAGHYKIVETKFENHTIKLLVSEQAVTSTKKTYLSFDKEKTYLFGDDWLIE